MKFRNLTISYNNRNDIQTNINVKDKFKKLLTPLTIEGQYYDREKVYLNIENNSDNELLFQFTPGVYQFTPCFIDIRKIIIEWKSYQDERFCQLGISVNNDPSVILDEVISKHRLKFKNIMFLNVIKIKLSLNISCLLRNLLDYG